MLYLLTGDIQIGKTRWLLEQIANLENRGITVCGVVAPGIWINHEDGSYEKTGIDNLLLPDRRIVAFASRRDLALGGDRESQATRAGLGWDIHDAAIDEVNAHFARLSAINSPSNRVLVVDELGRLELECGGGLVEAVALLERGATPSFPHALAVVRAPLLDAARERFADVPWNGMCAIGPTPDGAKLLLGTW